MDNQNGFYSSGSNNRSSGFADSGFVDTNKSKRDSGFADSGFVSSNNNKKSKPSKPPKVDNSNSVSNGVSKFGMFVAVFLFILSLGALAGLALPIGTSNVNGVSSNYGIMEIVNDFINSMGKLSELSYGRSFSPLIKAATEVRFFDADKTTIFYNFVLATTKMAFIGVCSLGFLVSSIVAFASSIKSCKAKKEIKIKNYVVAIAFALVLIFAFNTIFSYKINIEDNTNVINAGIYSLGFGSIIFTIVTGLSIFFVALIKFIYQQNPLYRFKANILNFLSVITLTAGLLFILVSLPTALYKGNSYNQGSIITLGMDALFRYGEDHDEFYVNFKSEVLTPLIIATSLYVLQFIATLMAFSSTLKGNNDNKGVFRFLSIIAAIGFNLGSFYFFGQYITNLFSNKTVDAEPLTTKFTYINQILAIVVLGLAFLFGFIYMIVKANLEREPKIKEPKPKKEKEEKEKPSRTSRSSSDDDVDLVSPKASNMPPKDDDKKKKKKARYEEEEEDIDLSNW